LKIEIEPGKVVGNARLGNGFVNIVNLLVRQIYVGHLGGIRAK
jgi:hypothetical protein